MLRRTVDFLHDCGVFYLATIDGDKPRVRPFGLVISHAGKLYFGTSAAKAVYRQLQANPNVEISATSSSNHWIRITGKAVFENNPDVKRKAFEMIPSLEDLYKSAENPTFRVFYLANAEVVFYSFESSEPERYKIC